MALEKSHTTESGLVAPDAYHRIIEVRLGDRRGVSISVMIHANDSKRAANAPTVGGTSYRFQFNPSELIVDNLGNAISLYDWAYEKLKTLDEYS